MVDFSVIRNPLGPPRALGRLLKKAYRQMPLDFPAAELGTRRILAGIHKVDASEIIIGGAPSALLHLILRTLRPRKVLIPYPAEDMPLQACRLYGCEIVPFFPEKEREFDIEASELIAAALSGVDMLILSNPHDPTGRIIPRRQMKVILDFCQEKGIYVVIDEAHGDFVRSDISCINLISLYANMIVLRAPGASFGLEALRPAYGVCTESLSELIRLRQAPAAVSYFSLLALENIFFDKSYAKKTRAWLETEPERFFRVLSSLGGVNPLRPHAGFVFAELERIPAAVLCERLLARGAKVKNFTRITGPPGQYIRVSVLDRKSNDKFLDMFSRCLL